MRPMSRTACLLIFLALLLAAPAWGKKGAPPMAWFKGDVHTHDVEIPLPQLVSLYRAQGYHFLILEAKDEDQPVDIESFTGPDFLGIGGVEQGFLLRRARPDEPKDIYGHLNAFPLRDPLRNMDEVWVPEGVRLLQQVAPDAVLQLNHPCDGRWTPADLAGIYDQGIAIIELNRESHQGIEYALHLWDQALAQGYRLWGQLSTDLHHSSTIGRIGHILVRAPRLGREEILSAMRRGDFYSVEEDCQATLTSYRLRPAGEGLELEVATRGGERISFLGPGGKVVASCQGPRALYRVAGEPYLRVEVADAAGRRLFLQPVWPADLASHPAPREVTLPGRPLSLRLDPGAGTITGLLAGTRNLLRLPGGLRVKFAGAAPWYAPGAGRVTRQARATVLQGENGRGAFAVRQVLRPVRGGWDWTVEVTDRSGKDREAELFFGLPAVGPGWRTWLPNGQDPVAYSPQGFTLTYRHCHDGSPGVPLLAAFAPDLDLGVALAASPDTPFPELDFVSRPPARSLGLHGRHVRLPARGTVRFTVHLFAYRAGPETAYDLYRRRHPDCFRPAAPAITQARGAWWCANAFVKDEELDRAQELGIVFYQVHVHYPQMGEYWTPAPQWTTSVRQANSREQVQDIIRRAHARGMKTFLYTCSCECAHRLAESRYASSICRDEQGQPRRAWWYQDFEGEHCYLMNPDPAFPYGRSLLAQIDRLLATYPDTDGIFIDRTDYGATDYGHQDGLTMVDGRPAYQQAFGISRYLAAAARRLHRQGKLLMMNVPFYLEAARYADAVCADMHSRRLPIFRYLAGDKPSFYLFTDPEGRSVPDRLADALRWGVYPDYVAPSPENIAVYQAALPLVDRAARARLPDRPTWLSISQVGVRGQLFREDDGWLVTLTGDTAEPIRVTLQGVGPISRAALITATGRLELPVTLWGTEYVVDLPALSGLALLECR